MPELRVNRYLKDKAMNLIDHALGHPLDPMSSYRNHFATSPDSPEAKAFLASLHWEQTGTWPEELGGMAFFAVTDAGRKALAAHLKSIGDEWRAFIVSFEGYDVPIAERTHSKARYAYYLQVSDCWSDLTFKQFCKTAKVRVAA